MDEQGTVRELTEAPDQPRLSAAEVVKRLRTVSRDAAGLYAYYADRVRAGREPVSRNRAAKDLHVQAWQVRAWQQELVKAGLMDGPKAAPPRKLQVMDRDWWREAARRCVCARDGVLTHEQMQEHCGTVAGGIYRLLGEAEPDDDGGC